MHKYDRRNTYQYKLRECKLDELKNLRALLIGDHRDAFKKACGNLLGFLLTKEDTIMILTFAQFYDPTLNRFTFQDFLLAPTLEEFAHTLCIPVRDQVPYMSTYDFPESDVIAQAIHLKRGVVESNLRTKGNIIGFPSKFLIEKATLFANNGSWDVFYAILSLLIYGLWILTHFPRKGPFAENVGALEWSQRLMSLNGDDIVWYNHDYDGVEPIFSCGDFRNVPLIGSKGGLINYNHVLSVCQLGYSLKEKPEDKQFEEFLIAKGIDNSEMLKIHRAWRKIHRIRGKELDKHNCIEFGPYTEYVRARVKTMKLPYP
ncbi:uncharacterized protein LOC127098119 [Lathyrus oleraceus]|uniref:uncharacterized protein LOC127098119 n=1 Tax=Pisum sativum TaxID=3888 RepID=UPI0021D2A854|nr:uncharacterized protein LOC127098119 [Pisum sativum]